MKIEALPSTLEFRRIGVLMWSLVLCVGVLPATATAETELRIRDAVRVFNSAVSLYYFQKTKKHLKVESACYFDPQVVESMGCSWQTGQADPYRLRQKVKKWAVEGCENNNGENCIPPSGGTESSNTIRSRLTSRKDWNPSSATYLPTTRKRNRFPRVSISVAVFEIALRMSETTGMTSEAEIVGKNHTTHYVPATKTIGPPRINRADDW